jgi:phosphonate transport system substrate-binding protein
MKRKSAVLVLGLFLAFAAGGLILTGATKPAAESAARFTPDYEGIANLTFGIISTDTMANLKQIFEPFLADMEKQLRIPIKAYFASDYAGVITAMANGKIDAAWYGNKSAVEAVLESGGKVEVIAQVVGAGRDPGYHSLLITHVDSPLNSVDDVVKNHAGLSFGNGDVNSTSGYLVPTAFVWAPRKIDPKTYFKNMRNASHGANVQAVLARQVDFATNNTEQLKKLEQEDPAGFKKIKVIWTSPVIAKDPFVVRKDLPRELKTAIQAFFLAYGRLGTDEEIARARKVLAGFYNSEPFYSSSNLQLIPYFKLKFSILVNDPVRLQEVETLEELAPKYL